MLSPEWPTNGYSRKPNYIPGLTTFKHFFSQKNGKTHELLFGMNNPWLYVEDAKKTRAGIGAGCFAIYQAGD